MLENTFEWREWGLNFVTVGAIATCFFTILQGIGIWKQNLRVRREKSGESVSVIFFSYSLFYFFAFAVYGIAKQSIAMTFNGALGFVSIPMIAALWRYKRFTKIESASFAVFPLMIPAMILMEEERDILLLIFLVGGLFSIARQAYEAWESSDTSKIDPIFIAIFMATNAFWLLYAIAIDSLALKIFNPIAFGLFFFIFLMYWKKGRKTTV